VSFNSDTILSNLTDHDDRIYLVNPFFFEKKKLKMKFLKLKKLNHDRLISSVSNKICIKENLICGLNPQIKFGIRNSEIRNPKLAKAGQICMLFHSQ
jgi:hypothetical protein